MARPSLQACRCCAEIGAARPRRRFSRVPRSLNPAPRNGPSSQVGDPVGATPRSTSGRRRARRRAGPAAARRRSRTPCRRCRPGPVGSRTRSIRPQRAADLGGPQILRPGRRARPRPPAPAARPWPGPGGPPRAPSCAGCAAVPPPPSRACAALSPPASPFTASPFTTPSFRSSGGRGPGPRAVSRARSRGRLRALPASCATRWAGRGGKRAESDQSDDGRSSREAHKSSQVRAGVAQPFFAGGEGTRTAYIRTVVEKWNTSKGVQRVAEAAVTRGEPLRGHHRDRRGAARGAPATTTPTGTSTAAGCAPPSSARWTAWSPTSP
ncbi:hypothetical protein SCALM49S_08772 [Streptomyces californicus]